MNLTGIDYSPSAIQLSEKIREKEGMPNIKLKVSSERKLSEEIESNWTQTATQMYSVYYISDVFWHSFVKEL